MISGPKLPFKVRNSAMVTSPNGKGVVIFGGFNVNADQYSRWRMGAYLVVYLSLFFVIQIISQGEILKKYRFFVIYIDLKIVLYFSAVIELTGKSMETMKWTVLEQKLQFQRRYHVAFPIPDEMTNCQ